MPTLPITASSVLDTVPHCAIGTTSPSAASSRRRTDTRLRPTFTSECRTGGDIAAFPRDCRAYVYGAFMKKVGAGPSDDRSPRGVRERRNERHPRQHQRLAGATSSPPPDRRRPEEVDAARSEQRSIGSTSPGRRASRHRSRPRGRREPAQGRLVLYRLDGRRKPADGCQTYNNKTATGKVTHSATLHDESSSDAQSGSSASTKTDGIRRRSCFCRSRSRKAAWISRASTTEAVIAHIRRILRRFLSRD